MSYNKLTSLTANIEAIETAAKLFPLSRAASETEKQILSKYTGFGGIKEVLNIGTNQPVPDNMKETFIRLQDILHTRANGNEQIYNSMLNSVKSSVLTAFYTPTFFVQTVAKQIQAVFRNNGLQMNTFLEPSAGIGGFLPIATPATYTYAFEKDNVTGLVLSVLQDNTRVIIDGFETIDEQDIDHKTFDVIASNIPFGSFKVFDYDFYNKDSVHAQATKSIHCYFIMKGIDKLNEGGIIAFIAPRGVADAPANKFLRNYLVHNANMITALRLPDTLFMQTGGIEVGCDFFIFQKHSHKDILTSKEQLFLQVAKEAVPDTKYTTEYFNRIFTLPKTVVATMSQIQKNQFGKYVRKYQWQGAEEAMSMYLSDLLKSDFERYFRKGLFEARGKDVKITQLSLFDSFGIEPTIEQPKTDNGKRPYTDKLQWWMKDGTMVVFEGQLGKLQYRKIDSFENRTPAFVPLKLQDLNISRASDYFSVRETYFELSNKEGQNKTEYPQLRKQLNNRYDSYVQKWGFFHNNDNKEFILIDSLGMEVFSIEIQIDGNIMKADIMNEPVAFVRIDTAIKLTPTEALVSSLNYYGKVDMSYLTQTTDQTETELIESLSNEIFYNPITESWEHKGKFLAGNVVSKCKDIRTILPELTGNAKEWAETAARALDNVIPEIIPYEELDFNFGYVKKMIM